MLNDRQLEGLLESKKFIMSYLGDDHKMKKTFNKIFDEIIINYQCALLQEKTFEAVADEEFNKRQPKKPMLKKSKVIKIPVKIKK